MKAVRRVGLCLLFFVQAVSAEDIWQCIQPNGKNVFSNLPCPKGQEKLNYITKEGTFVKGFEENKRIAETLPKQKKPVIIYTSPQLYRPITNPVDCKNAKRAWLFERDKMPSKGFNRERLANDLIEKCEG